MTTAAHQAPSRDLNPHQCPLCAVDDARFVSQERRLQVVRCRRCGLAYVYPRPSEAELATFYNEEYYVSPDAGSLGYSEYERHELGLRLAARRRLMWMATYLAPGRLLDVGCAYGYFLDEARQAGWDVEGVELSADAAGAARTRLGLPVHTGTLHGRQFPDAAFDVVTLWDSLEHTRDPIGVLAEVYRVLRPGGCCFLTVPDAGTWIARALGARWFGYRKAGEHTFFFTRNTMRAGLARIGLRPLEVARGVWPCDLAFLAEKFAQYSPLLSRLGLRVLHATGSAHRVVMFPFIDMRVAACRPPTDATRSEDTGVLA